MELKYIYCVLCHNLLLNKLTVLEKPPVMTCAAARGQCWPVEQTGGAPWREQVPQVNTEGVEHHLSCKFQFLAAAGWQIYLLCFVPFHRMDGFCFSSSVRPWKCASLQISRSSCTYQQKWCSGRRLFIINPFLFVVFRLLFGSIVSIMVLSFTQTHATVFLHVCIFFSQSQISYWI